MAQLQLIGRIVLMDGERIERKAQSSLVRKPLSESARSPFLDDHGHGHDDHNQFHDNDSDHYN